jgi:transcriptional regulator with XRE-family HTH domain
MTDKHVASEDTGSLGKRVRQLRQRRGWSQQELADRVGVRQKQISSYERDVNVPSGEIFIKLANAFDVSLDYLAQRAPESAPQVTIADLELLERIQYVDRLADDDRALVKQVMDLVILKDRFRKLASEPGSGPAHIYALEAS